MIDSVAFLGVNSFAYWGQGAPSRTQVSMAAICSSESLRFGGISGPRCLTACKSKLSDQFGSIRGPESPPWRKDSGRSSLRDASVFSGPWQDKQCSTRMGRIAFSKCFVLFSGGVAVDCAGSGVCAGSEL